MGVRSASKIARSWSATGRYAGSILRYQGRVGVCRALVRDKAPAVRCDGTRAALRATPCPTLVSCPLRAVPVRTSSVDPFPLGRESFSRRRGSRVPPRTHPPCCIARQAPTCHPESHLNVATIILLLG